MKVIDIFIGVPYHFDSPESELVLKSYTRLQNSYTRLQSSVETIQNRSILRYVALIFLMNFLT
jgi:hypothetical protein